jgi:hypothetical protein
MLVSSITNGNMHITSGNAKLKNYGPAWTYRVGIGSHICIPKGCSLSFAVRFLDPGIYKVILLMLLPVVLNIQT